MNVHAFEKQYPVIIDPKSIPPSLEGPAISPVIQLNLQSAIQTELEKKLTKKYDYQKRGFSEKGTLVLPIFDLLFGGFQDDMEIKHRNLLEDLKSLMS